MEQLLQLVGLGGITLIRSVVKATKIQNGIILVLLSLIFGVVLNVALAMVLDTNVRMAVALGVITGFASNLYNDIKVAVSPEDTK